MEEPHTVDDDTPPTRQTNEAEGAYWKENARLLVSLMSIWFAVSFGAGILFREQLDQFSIGGYPLGFWFAQQGSIYVFIALIFLSCIRIRGSSSTTSIFSGFVMK